MLDQVQPIFIIGAPRSGTTMLQVLLAKHPKVATTVELTLFDRYVAPWLAAWELENTNIREKGWRLGLPMLWSEEEFRAFIRTFLERAYAKVMERNPNATTILDKNPGYSMHVNGIKHCLPRAKFIHIIRDGRDVACSLVAARNTMGFGFRGYPEGGVLWRNLVLGARQAAAFGSDYLELRFEQFLGENRDAYRKALNFCELPYEEHWLNETIDANTFEKMKERRATGDQGVQVSPHHYRTGKAGNWRTEFSPEVRFAFDLAAGRLLRDLGYVGEDWWAKNEQERTWLPRKHYWRRRKEALGFAWDWFKAAATGKFSKSLGKRAAE
jgi:hypothetical protein